ncbi:MAG: hypothetical protein HY343_00640 [Lentisphaerae bacterium]|nr:hypothetical protein [Lentisphaerota bacterium]
MTLDTSFSSASELARKKALALESICREMAAAIVRLQTEIAQEANVRAVGDEV